MGLQQCSGQACSGEYHHDFHDFDDHEHGEGGGENSDHSRMAGSRVLQVVVDHSLVLVTTVVVMVGVVVVVIFIK